MMNKTELIDKWAERLSDVISQHGPDAADLAIAVGRIGAVKIVLLGLVMAAICICLVCVCLWLSRRARQEFRKRIEEQNDAIIIGGSVGVVLAGGGSVASGVASIQNLTNLYAWAGMFHPEVYLAAQALGLA